MKFGGVRIENKSSRPDEVVRALVLFAARQREVGNAKVVVQDHRRGRLGWALYQDVGLAPPEARGGSLR